MPKALHDDSPGCVPLWYQQQFDLSRMGERLTYAKMIEDRKKHRENLLKSWAKTEDASARRCQRLCFSLSLYTISCISIQELVVANQLLTKTVESERDFLEVILNHNAKCEDQALW